MKNQSKSKLSQPRAELLCKADVLIEKLASTDALSYAARVKLCTNAFIESRQNSQSLHKIYSKPEYDLPYEKWKEFLKKTDQDLEYQCQDILNGFENYLENGQIPVPHGAMRMAILLRKMGENEREKRFLYGWIKHFPSGLGSTYGKLVERGLKVGAISESPEPIEAIVRPAGGLELRAILDDLKSIEKKATRGEPAHKIKPQVNKESRRTIMARLWKALVK